jgi:hypothetical protein
LIRWPAIGIAEPQTNVAATTDHQPPRRQQHTGTPKGVMGVGFQLESRDVVEIR